MKPSASAEKQPELDLADVIESNNNAKNYLEIQKEKRQKTDKNNLNLVRQ